MTRMRPSCIRPINPLSGRESGREDGGDSADKEMIQEDDEEHIMCGQYDKPPIRVAKDPGAPTEADIEEHNATHLPHRSWCPICVKARGKEDAHRAVKDKGDKAVVAMDYKTFGEDGDEDDKITAIVAKDEVSGSIAAHVCIQKGAQDRWVVDRICDDIDLFGHTDIILKGDGEPALVQLQNAIKAKRAHSTICQNPPAHNPQANGSAERAVQEVMGQIRALKIGLEQRINAAITTEWKILEWITELSTVQIDRCVIGRDGKTAYARRMGKNSSKEVVEIGERVLAKIARSQKSNRKQSLRSRWVDAIWVGIAKKSNEHIVVMEGEGPAIRCRTVKRRPMSDRWQANKVAEIRATPRRPNPKDAEDQELKTEKHPHVRELDQSEKVEAAQTKAPEELRRRNFKITKSILEKHGYSTNCIGCDAILSGGDPRGHTIGCRSRLEKAMEGDPGDQQRLESRDRRLHQGEKVSDKETVNERVQQENVQTEEQEDVQTAKIDVEMDNEEDVQVQQDVLYGNAEGGDEEIDGENTEKTRSSLQYEKRHYTKSEEGEAGGEGQQKKQKIANLNQEVRYLSNVYNLNKYDGTRQKMQRILSSMQNDSRSEKEEKTDITDIIKKVAFKMQAEQSPHEIDEDWASLYEGVKFYDDMNGGEELDKEKVIAARRLEMQFFKKMGVYSKVHKSEVKKSKEGKIITTRWIDTDKGQGAYRSRMVGREIKNDKRQDLFSPTPPLETMKLLVAQCANHQGGTKPKRI